MRLADLLIICFLAVDVQAIEILSGEYGSFSSPQHPTPYADNLDMEWRIEVREGYYIKLRFTAFDLEDSYEVDQGPCVYDYVVIKEGDKEIERFCGNNLLHPRDAPSPGQWINSHGNVITVEFVSDYSNEDIDPKGFSAHYSETDIDECEIMRYKQKYQLEDWDELVVCNHFCINVPASYYCSCRSGFVLDTNKHTCTAQFCEDQDIRDDQGVIMSPDYPQPYAKLSHCTWDIQVRDGLIVHFTFEREFEIEKHVDDGCAYDILKLTYGGDEKLFCGTEVPNDGAVMDMNTRHVTVQFDTDLSVEMKGFKISYNTSRIRCLDSLLTPGHGRITSPNAKGYYEFEDFVTYQCNRGYDLIGELRLDCLSNGKWNHPEPTCRIKSCGIPSDLKAVKYSSILDCGNKEFTYLETVTVKCNEWYELNAGNVTWRCEDSKKWVRDDNVENGTLPVCRPICGRRLVHDDAVDGQIAGAKIVKKHGGWPWMAFIDTGAGRKEDEFCGGSLVDEMTVVTAAHCLARLDVDENITVWFGLLNRGSDNFNFTQSFVVPANRRVIHPDYLKRGEKKAQYDGDIGVLKLDRPVNFSYWVHPICVPVSRVEMDLPKSYRREQTPAVVIGWGRNERGVTSQDLLKTRVPFVDRETCRLSYETEFFGREVITDNMLCAGLPNGRNDACKGDSGGPLMTKDGKIPPKWFLSGIVSFGDERTTNSCGHAKTYGVYTEVAKFEPFLSFLMEK